MIASAFKLRTPCELNRSQRRWLHLSLAHGIDIWVGAIGPCSAGCIPIGPPSVGAG
jgi:hypothetical protein